MYIYGRGHSLASPQLIEVTELSKGQKPVLTTRQMLAPAGSEKETTSDLSNSACFTVTNAPPLFPFLIAGS